MQPYNSHDDMCAHRCNILLLNQPTPTPCFTDGNSDRKPVNSQIDPLDIIFLGLYSFHMHCRCHTSNWFIVSTLIFETLLVRWYPRVHIAARTPFACAIYKNSILTCNAIQCNAMAGWRCMDARQWLSSMVHIRITFVRWFDSHLFLNALSMNA